MHREWCLEERMRGGGKAMLSAIWAACRRLRRGGEEASVIVSETDPAVPADRIEDSRGLGDLARGKKRYSLAAEFYDRHLASAPDDAAILVQSGHMHKECGQYAEAEKRYRSAFELTPGDYDLLLQLGHFYKVSGDLAQALSFYEKGAALSDAAGEAAAEAASVRAMIAQAALVAEEKARRDHFRRHIDRPDILALIANLRVLEPEIGAFEDITEWLAPPHHDRRHSAHQAIRTRIRRTTYDAIICVPWIRAGGADLVAGNLARALRRIRPGEHVLVLRTDHVQFSRPDLIPADVDTADVSDILCSLPRADAVRLLFSLIVGLAPKHVITVNSRMCWEMFLRFGERAADRMNLYAYLFCWDLTPSGHRAGYPSEFYPAAAPWLTATFTDTLFLKNELAEVYAPPARIRERTIMLPSPIMGEVRAPSAAQLGIASRAGRDRPLILWGARIDRQKKFDLLVEIARLMPDTDFMAWGEPLLDALPDITNLPSNLRLQGQFNWIADLPLDQADGWLYTSAWEGMPTAIIELARQGMAVVATSVGGIPELIDNTTGWPVPGGADAPLYVEAIRQMLARPDEKLARALHFQQRVTRQHSQENYDHLLDRALTG